MGTSLINTKPQDTYPGLLKTTDNAAISATLKTLSDGNGNDLPMQISTTAVNFTGTLTQNGSPVTTPPSGVSGAIQFSNGSAFASDATNLFWDDTNNRLGVGTNAPAQRLSIKGVGATSATSSLLITNSSNTEIFRVLDNGSVYVPGGALFLDTITPYNNNFVRFQFSKLLVGDSSIDASAKMQVDSTTNGFLPPRMTTTQKNNIASPAAGLIVYDTTLAKLCVRTTSAWETITSI
jgi:hypothetical protein